MRGVVTEADAGAGQSTDTARWHLARALAWRNRLDLFALAAGVTGILAFHYSGAASGSRDAFVFMGFDPDRAYLLTAGMGAALGGGLAGLAGGRWLTWVSTGLAGLVALFGHTFIEETNRALAGAGGAGRFDATGWLITTASLLAAGLLLGLAAGILAGQARAGLLDVGRGMVRSWRARDTRALPRAGLLAVITIVIGLVVAVPVLGQLVNYGADSLMLSGGAGGIPMTGEGGNPAAPVGGLTAPAVASAGPDSGSTPVGSSGQPWVAWRPQGTGSVIERALPAPWTGGRSTQAQFSIYLPPGYASSGIQYPVVYELPWPIALWDNGANIRPTLDNLIDSGQLPASIFVFLSSGGGPFVDNECIDAAAGVEAFDTFASTALVHYMDANFRTIARPAARTLMGDSQGGFCAANVLLHHPDVFRQEISFSGYYAAAPLLGMSPSAQAPYAGDRALELANSPILIDGRVAPALRRQMLFALIAYPTAPFYGSQYQQFSRQARALGYRVALIPTPYGHSWLGVRATLGPALLTVANREAAEGVFQGS